jgi:hypothetical protein
MSAKTKAVALLIGSAVILGGIAVASASTTKKNPADSLDDNDDDATETDDDIEVLTPGADGSPGTGPAIVVDSSVADDASEEEEDDEDEVFPVELNPVDSRAQEIASQDGTSTGDVINSVVDSVTGGQNATPLAAAETSPELDPDGTVALARLMLARETMPGWKDDRMGGDIAEWQRNVGLVSDSLYGIKSAARMAEEVGVLPLVRFWSKGLTSKKTAEKAYDVEITRVINQLKKDLPDSRAQIDALIASMSREVAVSFGNANPPAQKTLDFVQDVNDAIAESAERKAEKELKS